MHRVSDYSKQLKAVRASINCSERNVIATHVKAEKVALALQTGDFSLVEAVRSTYYRLLKTYKYGEDWKIPKDSKRSDVTWGRVAKSYEESNCTVEHYMKAQFQWFHAVFGTHPKITHLATPAARDRARLYEAVNSNITANSIPAKKEVAVLLRNSEKQMRALQEARNLSRREVYDQLVKPGLFMFPKEFLESDPEYSK